MTTPNQHPPKAGKELLASVSRSFALSLNVLPRPLRRPITVAYLLARLTDTLADAPQVGVGERMECLRQLDSLIQSGGDPEPLQKRLSSEYVPHHAHTGEQVLLGIVPETLADYRSLPQGEQDLVRLALKEIARGQQLDLSRFGETSQRRSLATAAELDEYTWLVAGCVGDFWTRTGDEVDPGFFLPGSTLEESCRLGVAYGQGLQLVNIIRDAGSDLQEGRCYLPREEMEAAGLELATLEQEPARFREAWQPWLQRCESGLRSGLEYTTHLRSRRCRLASGLPALIGLETLRAISAADDHQWMSGVKISRPQVKRLVMKGAVASLRRTGIAKLGHS